VTTEIIDKLKRIVGGKNTIFEDKEKLQAYGMDTLSLITGVTSDPDVAVRPESTEEIAAIMKLASEYKIPVTPRGAGTGLAGSATPTQKGIVLSLEKLNKILEIDPVDRVAVVEAGVITEE